MKVLVLLVDGFEETEAITPVDIMRRAGLEVDTAYVESNPVTGSHDIPVLADKSMNDINPGEYEMIFLPGGPGTKNLKANPGVIALVQEFHKNDSYIAAICAAPTVLAKAGVLENKKVTCFPGCEPELSGAVVNPEPYIVDGKIITGKGAGVSIPFGLQLVKVLKGEVIMNKVRSAMQVYWQE